VATRFLAAGGTIGLSAANHTERSAYIEFDLVVVTLWLLLWIPQLFFYIRLDTDSTGDAQRVLLGLIAVTASTVTGIYILLLHFGGGPLRMISTGPLAAGVAGLVVLITPVYRSLARTCWSRGISNIVQFSKYRQDWGKTLIELRKAVDRASDHSIARDSGAGAAEAAAPLPRSERRAPRPAQGWPKWGLLAACAILTFGIYIAAVTVHSNGGANVTGGLLIIGAFVTALACGAVMLLRRIIQRGARTHPTGATAHAIAPAPAPAMTGTTAQYKRAPSVVLMLGALLGWGPWSAAIGAWQAYGSSGYTFNGQNASTSTAHAICQAGQAALQPGICGSIDDHYTFGVAMLVIGALAFAGGMIGLLIVQRRNPRAWRQAGAPILAGLVLGIFAVAAMIIVAIVRSAREGTAGTSAVGAQSGNSTTSPQA
jgi:hypothetical protein